MMSSYDEWVNTVHQLGGVATTLPYAGYVGGGGRVDPNVIPAARFNAETVANLRTRLQWPAPDATAAGGYGYYIAPPEVIRESFTLANATKDEIIAAGRLLLGDWRRAAVEMLSNVGSGIGALAGGLLPWWAWAGAALLVANQLGFLKRSSR